jgi:hypothetical protein
MQMIERENRHSFLRGAILLFFLMGVTTVLTAQETGFDLESWNITRLAVQRNGMIALGSWALVNFAVSGFLMTRTEDRTYYFHQMNVFWNVVNLGIASVGFISALRGPLDLTLRQTLEEYRSFTRLLLINAGLDVLYITGGLLLYLKGGSSEKHGTRLSGYGVSLILQGGFLLLFDTVLAIINSGSAGNFKAAAGL